MFNFSIPTAWPATAASRKIRSFRVVNIMRVLDVFSMRQQFKVFKPIVGAIQILVVNLKSPFNRAIKGLPHRSMNKNARVFAVATKHYFHIVLAVWACFNWAVRRFASPRFTVFDAKNGGNASTQKIGNKFQSFAFSKHFLGNINLLCRKLFASGNSAHTAKVANFIQPFKPQNRTPLFHNCTMCLTNINGDTIVVGAQV